MEYVIAAFIFGLSGGLKPGALSIFVIHETLRRGDRAGLLASFAPFVSDGPIILAMLFVISNAGHLQYFTVFISTAGALYLVYIACTIWRGADYSAGSRETPTTFFTAVKINLLNPAPYMFWSTVGGAYLIRGTPLQGGIFIVVMLTTLALSKFAVAKSIALLGARSERRVQDTILKFLAVLLLVFAARLLYQGWQSIAA